MRKLAILIFMIGIWVVLATGCAWTWSKETIVRCPKCSTVFSVDDDLRLRQLRE